MNDQGNGLYSDERVHTCNPTTLKTKKILKFTVSLFYTRSCFSMNDEEAPKVPFLTQKPLDIDGDGRG